MKGIAIWKDKTSVLLGIGCALMLIFAVAGGFIHYSQVPFEDMWNGYFSVIDGNNSVWWNQHNEHRIILSRLLFWLDIHWFGGLSIFLIVLNYSLMFAVAYTLIKCFREIVKNIEYENGKLALECFIVAWLFMWAQIDNFIVGFQVSFFLAQLLPLGAFYWMYQSGEAKSNPRAFYIACLLRVLSVGTLANGLVALPLMVVQAYFQRANWQRIAILFFLSIVMAYVYFYQFHFVHGTIRNIWEDPVGILNFIIYYLGLPFSWIFRFKALGHFSQFAGAAAGLFFFIAFLWQARLIWRDDRKSTVALSLFMFIGYVLIGALVTAMGRLTFGVALRYSTPAIIGWTVLLVLYAPQILGRVQIRGYRYLFPVGVVFLLMLIQQRHALIPNQEKLFQQRVAALALELQAKDESMIKNIYPEVDKVFKIGKKRSDEKVSIFNRYPWVDDRDNLRKIFSYEPMKTCQGHVESVASMEGDNQYQKISGWLFNSDENQQPDLFRVLNEQKQIVGYGLTGMPRKDVKTELGKKAQYSGFQGYVLSDYAYQNLMLVGDHNTCQMFVSIKRMS